MIVILVNYNKFFPKAYSGNYSYFFLQTDTEPMKVQDGYITGSICYKLIKIKSYRQLAELKVKYPEQADSFLNRSLYE